MSRALAVAASLAFARLHSAAEPDAASTQTAGAPAGANPILREIVAAGRLPDLRWPDFPDYAAHVKKFYTASGYSAVWVRNGEPTPQARQVIEILQRADDKGLRAEDYDGSRWAGRITRLRQAASADDRARFDVALTVCVMRYVSDLRIGRVNPRHFKFSLDVGPKKYDLASFLRDHVIEGGAVQRDLEAVEPPFTGYERTRQALQRYVELARHDDGEPLPIPAKPVEPGGTYEGLPRLARLLRLLGDLPPEAAAPEASGVYGEPLVDGIKRFQKRHGLAPDGRLGQQTLKQLNVPLSKRVEQLRLTLERWRWVPYAFPRPPIVVNIPEFRLRALDGDGNVAVTSSVIVGKAYRHQTPVFERDMKFVVLRPYWNVPISIQRSELVPAIRRDRRHLERNGYEVITSDGVVVARGAIDDDVLGGLASGKLMIRQKPGPTNALGLVKLMFPNEHNVYLHSTPSQSLFSRSRRDFSHGCIRVESAAELAAWVLRDKPGWTLERVRSEMQGGKDDVTVTLGDPIPVLILYGTAVVDEDGAVQFFDDIYGHDSELQKVLARGHPYPG